MEGDADIYGVRLRVGGHQVPLSAATTWVTDYFSAERGRFGYPVYDGFDDTNATVGRITDGDLLAPALLNAPVNIKAFAGLQDRRVHLEQVLELPDALDLADAPDEMVDQVAGLYEILDTDRPEGVRGTILAKILHRKRPRLVPLYDSNIYSVYAEPLGPIPHSKDRSWAEYMRLLTTSIRADLQQPEWGELAALAPPGGPLVSSVRALDIVAWKLGASLRSPAAEDAE